MNLKTVLVQNYKSIANSEILSLSKGINVIVGKNNSGKTSFLEALSGNFKNKPHKGIEEVDFVDKDNSQVILNFELSADEVNQIINSFKPLSFGVVRKNENIEVIHYNEEEHRLKDVDSNIEAILNHALRLGTEFHINIGANKKLNYTYYEKLYTNDFYFFEGTKEGYMHEIELINNKFISSGIKNIPYTSEISYKIAYSLLENIYIFKAQRVPETNPRFADSDTLSTDASNLPIVLNKLQSNRFLFSQFVKLVQVIFPEIHDISVAPKGETLEIQIWAAPVEEQRTELVFSLSECGTGISQVLSILYVVLTSKTSKVIIIDEPQSFLHPSAIRKLIEIIGRYPQHQYIISTHSPTLISSSGVQKIIYLNTKNNVTSFEIIENDEKSKIQLLLSSLGVKLSDVFGADNVLWVEGETEEIIFPEIVQNILQKPLWGTKITCVAHTGDFEQKNKKRVENIFKIYSKLSKSASLLPPSIGFIFDREDRTQKEIDDMVRASTDKQSGKPLIHFISRRLYENYLIIPEAINAIISMELEGIEEAKEVSLDEINSWINKKFYEAKYLDIGKQKDMMLNWLRMKGETVDKVEIGKIQAKTWSSDFVLNFFHGAKFLKDLFSEYYISFDKTKHSVLLSRWIIDNVPNELMDIRVLLNDVLFGQND